MKCDNCEKLARVYLGFSESEKADVLCWEHAQERLSASRGTFTSDLNCEECEEPGIYVAIDFPEEDCVEEAFLCDDHAKDWIKEVTATEDVMAATAEMVEDGPSPLPFGRRAIMSRGFGQQPGEGPVPAIREMLKVGRNAPCPCGSGKKYKKCHGR